MTRTRITIKNLDGLCDRLNEVTGNPTEAYTRIDNRNKANPGNYHISGAYGGYALHQVANDSGGTHDTLGLGHVSPRQLWDAMHCFLKGIAVGEGRNA